MEESIYNLGEEPMLNAPFDVTQVGATCHVVRDSLGELIAWTPDRATALVVAGLLEHACCKLNGTRKRKEYDTAQRPHRISRVDEAPEVLEAVPPGLLETTVDMEGGEDYGFASGAEVVEAIGPNPGELDLAALDVMGLWSSRGLRCVPGKKKGMYEAECPCRDQHENQSRRDGGNCLWKHEYPGYWCRRTGCPFNGGQGAGGKRVDMFHAVVEYFGVDKVQEFCPPRGEVGTPKKSRQPVR
jgi:hypothetical protein